MERSSARSGGDICASGSQDPSRAMTATRYVRPRPRRGMGWLPGESFSSPALAVVDQAKDFGSENGHQGLPFLHHFGDVRGQGCGQGVGKRLLMCARIVVSR
jgi:hypothetical protein